MGTIRTNVQTLLEHEVSHKFNEADFPRLGTLAFSAAGTATITPPAGTAPTVGAGKKVFLAVSSITDIATDIVVTFAGDVEATIPAHAPLDSLWQVLDLTAPSTPVEPTTIAANGWTVTGGNAGVLIEVIVVDESNWLDCGKNFNESLGFQKGALTASVPRGWSMSDHMKRVRVQNSFSMTQMYSSNLEGVMNLRGRTVLLKDEVHTDGGAVIKEVNYYVGAQFLNVAKEIGQNGEVRGDMANASGTFKRGYTWTRDTDAIAALAGV